MAIFGTYYIDGPTLATAVAVYSDALMTTPAPDGYYSDGTIVRQQVAGILISTAPCPSCIPPCDYSIVHQGTQGIYTSSYNMGTNTGCIVIYFNPSNIPNGIRVKRGAFTYNRLTCEADGFHGSPTAGSFTYVGNTLYDCNIGTTLDGGGYSGLAEYIYSLAVSNFVNIGSAGVVTGTSADVSLSTALNPQFCTLYLPKTASSAFNIDVEIFRPCVANDDFEIQVNCPVLLTGVPTSDSYPVGSDDNTLCNTVGTYPNTYYNVPNYGGVAGCPVIHEFYVQDPYGNVKVPAGKYKIPANISCGKDAQILTVDSNGVIVDAYECPI